MEKDEPQKCISPKRDASLFLHSLQSSVENLEREEDTAVEYFDNNFWREPIIELTPTVIDQQLSGKSGNEETIGVKDVVSKERKENQTNHTLFSPKADQK